MYSPSRHCYMHWALSHSVPIACDIVRAENVSRKFLQDSIASSGSTPSQTMTSKTESIQANRVHSWNWESRPTTKPHIMSCHIQNRWLLTCLESFCFHQSFSQENVHMRSRFHTASGTKTVDRDVVIFQEGLHDRLLSSWGWNYALHSTKEKMISYDIQHEEHINLTSPKVEICRTQNPAKFKSPSWRSNCPRRRYKCLSSGRSRIALVTSCNAFL